MCTVGNTSSGSSKKMVDAGGGNTMYISPVSCTSFIIRKLKDDTDFKNPFVSGSEGKKSEMFCPRRLNF